MRIHIEIINDFANDENNKKYMLTKYLCKEVNQEFTLPRVSPIKNINHLVCNEIIDIGEVDSNLKQKVLENLNLELNSNPSYLLFASVNDFNERTSNNELTKLAYSKKPRNPESLQNICLKYVSKNIALFDVKKVLPADMNEKLENFANKLKL